MSQRRVIAVDLGAESGRVVEVHIDDSRLHLTETHRFTNTPVQVQGTLYWDVLRLWHDIKTGIDQAQPDAASVGIDTWGVDFALLDKDGAMIANPVHYRDGRTEGMMEWVFERVPRRDIFERTGIQFMMINTLYQLTSMVHNKNPLLGSAATLLTIPDLFHYWLSGARSCEFTHVSTTQCYNPKLGNWDFELLSALDIPTHIFPQIVQPGTQIGHYNGIPVTVPASHDTGSAVVAVPAENENYAYISSGTWSLVGLEVDAPVINDDAYEANITNEGGADGKFRLLKNVMGLWIAQQCRAAWHAQGATFTYDDLTAQAVNSEPFRSLIDPDNYLFLPPGDMPARIREFCHLSHQPIPKSIGQIMRTIYESLALKYRYALDDLVRLTGRTVDRIHIIGGGVQNTLLCQMTADATGKVVVAGPVEATALGNAIVQFISLGELDSVAQGRTLVRNSVTTVEYYPKHVEAWEAAYEQFRLLVKGDKNE